MTPIAQALPRPDETVEPGRFGSLMPVTPANGFMLICPTKPGSGDTIRAYGKTLEEAVKNNPAALEILRLHYLRWVLFDNDTRFIYMGIFDTDFDKYIEDAIMLFNSMGVDTIFESLAGFPEDWRTNAPAFAQYCRDHQCHSFAEYAEYPWVSGVEVVSALEVKQSFSDMLDQMQ